MCLPRHVEKTDKIFRLQRKYLRVTENIQVTETTFKSEKKYLTQEMFVSRKYLYV